MQQTMTLQDGCQNLADCPNLPYFTYMINIKFPSSVMLGGMPGLTDH